jgi:hypothetical protein
MRVGAISATAELSSHRYTEATPFPLRQQGPQVLHGGGIPPAVAMYPKALSARIVGA